MLGAGWVFKLHWLIPLLSAWLKLSRRVRLSVVVLTLLGTALAICCVYILRINVPQQSLQPPTQLNTVTSPVVVNSLPGLTSAALYELTQAFENVAMNQQRDSVSLAFTANWRPFVTFINQLAASDLAPQTYRLYWGPPDLESRSGSQDLTVDLQLAHGLYQGGPDQAIALPAVEHKASPSQVTDNCSLPPFPAITVQAAWPARGYIQIIINGRSERLTLQQRFEHSWQLLRIGSEAVEFRWHGASPTCSQTETVTVAI